MVIILSWWKFTFVPSKPNKGFLLLASFIEMESKYFYAIWKSFYIWILLYIPFWMCYSYARKYVSLVFVMIIIFFWNVAIFDMRSQCGLSVQIPHKPVVGYSRWTPSTSGTPDLFHVKGRLDKLSIAAICAQLKFVFAKMPGARPNR